jgi:hypothetical protein
MNFEMLERMGVVVRVGLVHFGVVEVTLLVVAPLGMGLLDLLIRAFRMNRRAVKWAQDDLKLTLVGQ